MSLFLGVTSHASTLPSHLVVDILHRHFLFCVASLFVIDPGSQL